MFRTPFYQNAAVVCSAFMRCGAQCLDDFFSTVRGKALRGGSITVLHTHGRNGQYHPHLHLLATSGGYDAQSARWEHLQYLPYALLRRKWQWHLLSTLRKTLATDAIKRLVDVWASIMASATPFCFCTTQKHLSVKIVIISMAYTYCISRRNFCGGK
jgi:hypothetical protein